MTTPQPDRPARSRPRPAADAGVDPIDYGTRAAPTTQPTTVEGKGAAAPAAAPDRAEAPTQQPPLAAAPTAGTIAPVGGMEVTVQLSTRISPDVNDVLTLAKQRTGKSKRTLIEEAIVKMWAN